MLKVGITGNIGSGKTLVCKMFETLGVPVFYADRVARNLYDEPEVKVLVTKAFGPGVYGPGQKLMPKKLATLIFNDKNALLTINNIIHSRVLEQYLQWLDGHSEKIYTLHEAAILFENKLQDQFDFIINVSAPEQLRLKRVMKRDRLSEAAVLERMKSQWPDVKKNQLSDFVISNGGQQFLIPQVFEIHNQLMHKKL